MRTELLDVEFSLAGHQYAALTKPCCWVMTLPVQELPLMVLNNVNLDNPAIPANTLWGTSAGIPWFYRFSGYRNRSGMTVWSQRDSGE